MMPMLNHKAVELEAKIKRHQRLYDQGMPEISDAEFDALVKELRELAPDSPVLDELGAPVTGGAGRHAIPMLSLDKVYETVDLVLWASRISPYDFLVQPKYDGVAISLTYNSDGKLEKAATRGDGETGEDVTDAVVYAASLLGGLNIPLELSSASHLHGTLGRIEVRGELLMPVEVFKLQYAKLYANPRNLIAGVVSRNTGYGPLYDARFVAYDYVIVDQATDLEKLEVKVNALAYAGFDIGEYEMVDCRDDIVRAAQRKWVTPFEIDGVVFKANDPSVRRALGATAHHPRWAIAWKYQGQTGQTRLVDVVWETSRTGVITPVAVMESIELSGVTITRATLHNYGRFRSLFLKVGDTLQVTRRGGVIPHVETARRSPDSDGAWLDSPLKCPACGWNTVSSGEWLLCSNRDDCSAVRQGRLLHWCRSTGMLGIGPEFIERMYDAGVVRTPVDLYRLDATKLALAGFGSGQIDNILDEINHTRTLDPVTFLTAIGIDDLGRTTARTILPTLDWETLQLANVRGIKLRRIQSGLDRNQDLIDALLVYVRVQHKKPVEIGVVDGPFAGKRVVFTGALTDMDRSVAQDLVRQYGGETPASLTRDTDILVIGGNAKESQTTKRDKAHKYNQKGAKIEVITEDEFARRVAEAMSTTLAQD